LPLPEQAENAAKEWIIFQLNKAMTIVTHTILVSTTTFVKSESNSLYKSKGSYGPKMIQTTQ
jgi:hypothetical protein